MLSNYCCASDMQKYALIHDSLVISNRRDSNLVKFDLMNKASFFFFLL